MKPIIGIACFSKYKSTDDPFMDNLVVVNNYSHKVNSLGAIPIGLLVDNDHLIKESLELCDAFIIQGGNRIHRYVVEIIDYAIKNNKPLLGICMGMQALGIYSVKNKKQVLYPIESNINHWIKDVKRDNKDELSHYIKIENDSHLYQMLNTNKLKVNSFHKYALTEVGSSFKVVAKSSDNVIEAIEMNNPNNLIIGVQFHPEVLNKTNGIFTYFINYTKRRNNHEK